MIYVKKRDVLIKLIYFFVLILIANGFSQTYKNFLILENPFEHRIFNKYEQNLSINDSTYFLKYTPIEILAEDTLLSDNYTHCFIGRIENQTYFFLIPEKNKKLNSHYSSNSNYVKNALSIMDTIQIIKNEKVLLFNTKDKNQKEYLPIDTKLLRIFVKGSRTYVKNLIFPAKYGWCDLTNENSWEIYKPPLIKIAHDFSEIELIVKTKLSEVNGLLEKLFAHFNRLNHSGKQVPYWTFANKEEQITCTLLNNESNYNFNQSTNILINELQLQLAHTPFKAYGRSGEIIIKRK
jgi:hypothetical protein